MKYYTKTFNANIKTVFNTLGLIINAYTGMIMCLSKIKPTKSIKKQNIKETVLQKTCNTVLKPQMQTLKAAFPGLAFT